MITVNSTNDIKQAKPLFLKDLEDGEVFRFKIPKYNTYVSFYIKNGSSSMFAIANGPNTKFKSVYNNFTDILEVERVDINIEVVEPSR